MLSSYKIEQFWREKIRKKANAFPFPALISKWEEVTKCNYFVEQGKKENRCFSSSTSLSQMGRHYKMTEFWREKGEKKADAFLFDLQAKQVKSC